MKPIDTKRLFPVVGCLAACLLLASAAAAYEAEECLDCHKSGSTESRLTIDPVQFDASTAGQVKAAIAKSLRNIAENYSLLGGENSNWYFDA